STPLATSSGKPHRFCGTKPPSINVSYFSLTPLVISVCIIPGLNSMTEIFSAASRTAHNLVTIANPALDMQYSQRLIEAVVAEIDDTITILKQPGRMGSGF